MEKLRVYECINVGNAVKVTYKGSIFIGICISKDKGHKSLLLRNVVDGFGIEYRFNVLSYGVTKLDIILGISRKTRKKKLYSIRKSRMKHVR